MWIMTTFGFFSVVQKSGTKNLTVRARVRADLDRLRDQYLPGLAPTKATPARDYGYRATVSHRELSEAMTKIVADISYDNFKSEVMRTQGHTRAEVYADVWSTLQQGLPILDQKSKTDAMSRSAEHGGATDPPMMHPIHATTSAGAHCVLLDRQQQSATAIAEAMAANGPGDVQVLLDPRRQTADEMVATMNAIRHAARKKAGLPED